VTDPLGRVTQFGFDTDGNLIWTQDPLHAADSGTDTRSYRTYTDYDSYGRPGRQSQPKSTTLDRGELIWADTSYDPTATSPRSRTPTTGSRTPATARLRHATPPAPWAG
jgi:hypothetical protein